MKHPAPTGLGSVVRGGSLALAALAALALAPQQAHAALPGSAGNTIVRNTITVNYADAKGNAQAAVSATVDITVTTVAATPTVIAPSSGSTDGTGATLPYTFRVRSNSNGPGAISFATSDGTFTNLAAGTAPTVPLSIFLGATVIDPSETKTGSQAVAVNATITLAVPNDGGVPTASGTSGGAVNDGVINGLVVNDIVYVGDSSSSNFFGPFTVTAISDPAVGNGATAAPGSITLKNTSSASISFTPAAGVQIVEAKDVTLTVTQGQIPIVTAQNPASWVTTLSATMGAAAAGTGTVTTNAHAGKLSIVKYVRNVTTPAAGTGTQLTPAVTVNGVSSNLFYPSGVVGKPGEVLEYLAVVTDAGTGTSTAVSATDVVPTYAALVAGASYGSSTAGSIFAKAKLGTGTEYDLKTDGTGGDTSTANGKTTGVPPAPVTMNFFIGSGATSSAGGSLTTGQAAYLIYQVKIQ